LKCIDYYNVVFTKPDGCYKIVNVNSGKALDLYQLSLNNGGTVDQWEVKVTINQSKPFGGQKGVFAFCPFFAG
jgi:hypothetical protein